MSKKSRLVLSPSESTLGLLKRLDNTSGYIDSLIQNTWGRALQALSALQAAGWKSNEILCACAALNGMWLHAHAPTWHGDSLASYTDSLQEWEITPERWIELAKSVQVDQGIAFALDLVVSEFWNGNTYLEALIRRESRSQS